MLPALSTRRFSLPTFLPSHSLRQEVDRLFDQFFGNAPGTPESAMARGWNAPVAIWDDDQHVYVTLQKTTAAQPKKVAIKAG